MSLFKEANTLYKANKFQEAYDVIIDEIKQKNEYNQYAYASYGRICKKLKKQNEFLDCIRPLITNNTFDAYFFADIIGWCIFDLYILPYNDDSDYDIIEKSEFIINYCEQKKLVEYKYNPLIFTIYRVVKYLKSKASINYKKILELLEKLDPKQLPIDDEHKITTSNNREMELASTREVYYQDLTKAYEKTGSYEKAYNLCNIALDDISCWHYRNNIWIEARKYYCLCKINKDFDNDVNKYIEIAKKQKFWFMFYNLSDLFISRNRMEEGLYYLCLAFDISKDPEYKWEVMMDLGNILLNVYNKEKEAVKFYQAALYFRTINGWNIRKDLEYRKKEFNLSDSEKPDLDNLKKITVVYLMNKDSFLAGKIKMINTQKGFGFIQPITTGKDIYFKTFNIINKKNHLEENTYVRYTIFTKNDKIEAKNIEKI